ncbi:biopolymer transporter ExbD [Neptunitalea chrysea]|uniref:Biopolymer transporter ExbD n=1 Tax=Neptunitalea chrysea TaxID=1647581 RepID=A0A9W6B584_9FLAO|nr:biopolymer transporter ExbD [Neptunitalea chrysea]GLB50968.1 biopolymer transporter ExbD [Neptunitalea chrysea]
MSKFKKKKSGDLPAVSTASLPDIVFMLLFFFMTVTVMKDSDLMVTNKVPTASEVQKLDKKDPVMYIYAGKPTMKYQKKAGTSNKVQINDKFVVPDEIPNFVLEYQSGLHQDLQNRFITALKIDEDTNMGIVTDVKEALRDANALKINYITKDGDPLVGLKK